MEDSRHTKQACRRCSSLRRLELSARITIISNSFKPTTGGAGAARARRRRGVHRYHYRSRLRELCPQATAVPPDAD
ncbi:hypothetical protein EVAR_23817_1 [Eumeta japonica]|uniref:Uncharacterized protein n=1 Tax=Eumeta variegata TaxID=151549 RepID=A0A4C1VKF4_EUMVA|nr:hypothetical protein EVAR_23817_1 [Eumeta japonica]